MGAGGSIQLPPLAMTSYKPNSGHNHHSNNNSISINSASAPSPTPLASNKPGERLNPDEAMSFRGKCSAMKTILYTDGSKLAYMKYMKEKQSEGYLDYYFEIDEIIHTKGPISVIKIEELKERYQPRDELFHCLGEPAYRRNEVRLDIWQNIEMTFSDEPMSETRISEIIVQLKISQAYALSVLASYLDDFLRSVYYENWERDQKTVEHDNIKKKSGSKYMVQTPNRPNAGSVGTSPASVAPVSPGSPFKMSSSIVSMGEDGPRPGGIPLSRLSSTASSAFREISGVSMAGSDTSDPVAALHDTKPTQYPSILLADDSSVSAKITEMLLVKNGHKVQKVSHGRDALQYLLNPEKVFDIALIDLYMPILDGFEAIKSYRDSQKRASKGSCAIGSGQLSARDALLGSSSKTTISTGSTGKVNDVLIIGMSADAHATTRQRAIDAGVDFFLLKPFTIEKLAQVLASDSNFSVQRQAEIS